MLASARSSLFAEASVRGAYEMVGLFIVRLEVPFMLSHAETAQPVNVFWRVEAVAVCRSPRQRQGPEAFSKAKPTGRHPKFSACLANRPLLFEHADSFRLDL
jgi:hypothetical protein